MRDGYPLSWFLPRYGDGYWHLRRGEAWIRTECQKVYEAVGCFIAFRFYPTDRETLSDWERGRPICEECDNLYTLLELAE
jgi:hypothetical protein